MAKSNLIATSDTENGSCTPRVLGQQAQHGTLGKVLALRRRLDDKDRAESEELHRLAAPIAGIVLDAFGKDDAAAEFLKQPKQVISDKRNGARGLVLWELVAMLAAEPETWLAFDRLFCELHGYEPPQPKKTITRAELADMALELMSSGPLMTLLENEAERRRGATADEITNALTK